VSLPRFLDTNILLYSISRDPAEMERRQRAVDLLDLNDGALSVQVLQEFYVQATRPSRPDPVPARDSRWPDPRLDAVSGSRNRSRHFFSGTGDQSRARLLLLGQRHHCRRSGARALGRSGAGNSIPKTCLTDNRSTAW
jgi:hypothetical protein